MISRSPSLVALWIGWLATLLASFVAARTAGTWWPDDRLDLRMVSCLLLVVAAWRGWMLLRGGGAAGAAMFWVAIGMTLGFYGDSHVGDRFWWPPFPQKIVGGIVFYGLGHLAYVAACWLTRRAAGLSGGWVWNGPIFAWQVVALVSWGAVALTSDKETGLRVPTLVYTLLVAATPGFASALAAQRHTFGWMALGGALFLASDVLLAWQLFHEAFDGIDELTWVCYAGGEMLIVYGALHGLTQLAPAPPSEKAPPKPASRAAVTPGSL